MIRCAQRAVLAQAGALFKRNPRLRGRPPTSRQARHARDGAFDDARCPVHQDLLARRRHPSHAGADGGAATAASRAVLLGGGGGVRAARANSSGRLGRHPGRIAPLARHARGRRHGYDANSIRERAASWLYDVRHRVARDLHAIARNRMLTGLALGYAPGGAVDFGLSREAIAQTSGEPYGILFHATARPEKEWPE